MENSLRIGRIAGIPIQIHYSWLVAFALIAWSLSEGLFAMLYPWWEPLTYWLVGIASALALFVCVLAHELSHSLLALARGQRVRHITLFIFGGVSAMEEEAHRPADEFAIAAVGPLASLALAGAFWLGSLLLPEQGTPVEAMLRYLAIINLLLAAFNLLPGFPLDGGRVLRSIIWAVTGNLGRATRMASYVGQGLAFLLIFWGISQLLTGNILAGVWIALIGWFLNSGAVASRRDIALREDLEGVRVRDLMDRAVLVAHPEMSIYEFVFEHVLRHGRRALPVMDHGRMIGIVTVTDTRRVPHGAWAMTPIEAVMTRAPLTIVRPEDDVTQALSAVVDGDVHQVPVMEDSRLVGMLSRVELLRFLQTREEVGDWIEPAEPQRRRAA